MTWPPSDLRRSWVIQLYIKKALDQLRYLPTLICLKDQGGLPEKILRAVNVLLGASLPPVWSRRLLEIENIGD
jgi:hypothetical protein